MKIICLLLLLITAVPLQARVVTVNIDKVFSEYEQTKLADRELQQRIELFRKGQAEKVAEYQQLQQEFNRFREDGAKFELSEPERRDIAEKASELITRMRQMEQELQQVQTAFQREVEDQGRRMRQRIVDEIRSRIQELAADRDWEVVLDSSAMSPNGVPMVHYSAPTTDVTQEIIRSLHSNPVTQFIAPETP